MSLLRWIPPTTAAAVDLDTSSAARFQVTAGVSGLLPAPSNLVGVASPGQYGDTAVALAVGRRTVTWVVHINAASQEDAWQARQELAAALWMPATRPGERPTLGTLRLARPGMDEVEVSAAPVNSPRGERWLSDRLVEVEIEWAVPDPRWRETEDQVLELRAGGGFSFPLSMPWSSLGANLTGDVVNGGTTESPIVARIYGPVTTPRLILQDTDEVLELTGEVEDGEYLRVDTGFSRKSIGLYENDGTFLSNAMGRLNLDAADFWQLPPGISTVRFEADDNPGGGYVWLSWRNRLGGV